MERKKIRYAAWYPTAVAICIGVVLYVLLTRFSSIWASIQAFLGYFKTVILGCVIAYIVNPMAKRFERLFVIVKKERTRRILSNGLAFLLVILLVIFALLVMVPEILQSIETFVGNLNTYIDSVNTMLENWGVSKSTFDLSSFVSSSEDILDNVARMIKDNVGKILAVSASAGKNLFQWAIAFILSIYLLADKQRLKSGIQRLLRVLFDEEYYEGVQTFFRKCDRICNRYIVYNLIDSVIVGGTTAVFMSICSMQYVGLISFVVAATNLVPSFGPFVGMLIGSFILLMVTPVHALVFLVFTLILQVCDGYIIKPRLFGNSLGVSGLWILVGVLVGGSMFGVIGILLAIPAVAIIDFAYGTYLIPWLEKKRKNAQENAAHAHSSYSVVAEEQADTTDDTPSQNES